MPCGARRARLHAARCAGAARASQLRYQPSHAARVAWRASATRGGAHTLPAEQAGTHASTGRARGARTRLLWSTCCTAAAGAARSGRGRCTAPLMSYAAAVGIDAASVRLTRRALARPAHGTRRTRNGCGRRARTGAYAATGCGSKSKRLGPFEGAFREKQKPKLQRGAKGFTSGARVARLPRPRNAPRGFARAAPAHGCSS
jgi:hypothetical protein